MYETKVFLFVIRNVYIHVIYLLSRSVIFLEDGHLTISAQRNKNLTFQTTGNQAQIRFEADTPLILPKGSSAIGGVSAEESLARGTTLLY